MRSRLLLMTALAAGSILVQASCSLLVDTGGLAGDGVGLDGGDAAPASDAAVADARQDTFPPGRFCEGGSHFLCADFDEGKVADGFSRTRIFGASSVMLDEQHVSAPRSMRTAIPAVSDSYAEARLERDLPSAVRHLRLSADMFFCASESGDVHELFKLLEPSGGNLKLLSTGTAARVVARFVVDLEP